MYVGRKTLKKQTMVPRFMLEAPIWPCVQSFICTHTSLNYVTETFILVSYSDTTQNLLCSVHGSFYQLCCDELIYKRKRDCLSFKMRAGMLNYAGSWLSSPANQSNVFAPQAGYPPFWSTNRGELFGLITRGKYSFPDEEWKSISEGAKRLIKSMVRDSGGRCVAD